MSSVSSGIAAAANTGSGIDVQATVDQIIQSQSGSLNQLQGQQSTFNVETAVLNSISGSLSTLQTKVNSLNDVLGALNSRLATSSNTGIFSAGADATAASGSHLIRVTNLASTAAYYTDPQTSATTTLATGTFDLQLGTSPATTITVDSTNNTLNGLASSINGLKVGVTASVINDANGSRLALVSTTSGTPGNITIANNTTALNFTQATQGLNAQLTVDGVPISSTTNTVAGVLQGVTLTLNSAAPGTDVSLVVAPDTGSVKQAINDFVSAYNVIISSINQQFQVDSSGNGGTLTGNSSLRTLQSSLLNNVNFAVSGNNGTVNLSSIGVNLQNDGTLLVDNSALTTALNNNFTGVHNLFQTTGTNTGFADNFSKTLLQLTDSTAGPIGIELKGVSNNQADIAQQIQEFQDRLATQRTLLIKTYSQIDAQLRQLPYLQAQIAAELAAK